MRDNATNKIFTIVSSLTQLVKAACKRKEKGLSKGHSNEILAECERARTRNKGFQKAVNKNWVTNRVMEEQRVVEQPCSTRKL